MAKQIRSKPISLLSLAIAVTGSLLIYNWTLFQIAIAETLIKEIAIFYGGLALAGPALEHILKPKKNAIENTFEKLILGILVIIFSLYSILGIRQKCPAVAIYEFDIIKIYSNEDVRIFSLGNLDPPATLSPIGLETLAVRRSINSDELTEGVLLESQGLDYALQKSRWTAVSSQSDNINKKAHECNSGHKPQTKPHCFKAVFRGKDLIAEINESHLILKIKNPSS